MMSSTTFVNVLLVYVAFLGINVLWWAQNDVFVHSFACKDEYSCTFQSITEVNGEVQCDGYHSCYRATLIQGINESLVYCRGSYSCYKADTIIAISSDFYCRGLFSCAMVDSIYHRNGLIRCDGEMSCFDSNIYVTDSTMSCNGDHSCADSTIIGGDNIQLRGQMSGHNTVFYSNNSLVSYHFFGVSSGNGAKILCNDNFECYVYCYTNACNNLTLICNTSTEEVKMIFLEISTF